MAVNVSPRQLGRDEFAATVTSALRDSGADPNELLFEITESTFLRSTLALDAEIASLTAMGVGWTVDDFGTGYSSLMSLKRFPITHLKVDRSFVEGIQARPDDRAIVAAIVRLADELHITTVAEGIERPEQLAVLRGLGCKLGQGNLLSEPRPGEAIDRLLPQINAP